MKNWKLCIDRKKAARYIKGALLSLPLCGGLTFASIDAAAEACAYDDDCYFGEACAFVDGGDVGSCEPAICGTFLPQCSQDEFCRTEVTFFGMSFGSCQPKCWNDDDCDFGEVCENAGKSCPEGAYCILAPKPTGQCQPGCWSDDDCAPGDVCEGERTCPDGAICILAPKLGQCEPGQMYPILPPPSDR
ncbi:MAG: hypothetical protein MUC50_04330 [Myxococcota bacterium]|jgi:hypothetical protein|nr:hypothetical protein [Myxococcota bacterium]